MRLAQLSRDDGNVLGVMLFSERICQQTATANLTGFMTFLHIMRDDEISGYLISRSQEVGTELIRRRRRKSAPLDRNCRLLP